MLVNYSWNEIDLLSKLMAIFTPEINNWGQSKINLIRNYLPSLCQPAILNLSPLALYMTLTEFMDGLVY